MFESFICRSDGVVYQRYNLIEFFVLLFFDSDYEQRYLNSGILECLAPVVILRAA